MRRDFHQKIYISIIGFLIIYGTNCQAAEECFYTDDNGIFVSASSKQEVPEEFKQKTICTKIGQKRTNKPYSGSTQSFEHKMPEIIHPNANASSSSILKPSEVELDGVTRRIKLSTRFGTVQLQWQTSTEKIFGKSPRHSVKEAWQAGAKTLATNPFPFFLRSSKYGWNMVFMDEEATRASSPFESQNCHPGWIRPPADIFISSSRLVTGCDPSGKRLTGQKALNSLNRTLVHEFGHAVEYKLLGNMYNYRERYHSEGFAEWFETLAANKLQGSNKLSIESSLKKRAKESFKLDWNPTNFDSSSEDYSKAYAMIATLAERRSIRTLMDIYEQVREKNIRFSQAVESETGWSLEDWKSETLKFLN